MVNLHVFNFNNQLSTERAKICLEETLNHQTDFKLFIWTEDNPEIKQIIDNSKYCKRILEEEFVYWPSVYDYTKLYIMNRYGGWFFELDQIIETDLSKVEIEKNKSYFNTKWDGTFVATTWHPIYVSKGFDTSKMIQKADEVFSTYLEQNEAVMCEVIGAELSCVCHAPFTDFSHIDTGSFNKPILYGYNRSLFEKDGYFYIFYKDFKDRPILRKYYTFDVFMEISKSYDYVSQLKKICENGGSVEITPSLLQKLTNGDTLGFFTVKSNEDVLSEVDWGYLS